MNVTPRLLLLALAVCLGSAMLAAPAPAQTLVMPQSQLEPAAKLTATLGKDDNNNTTVDLKAQYLAQPESLDPARRFYVVWVQASRVRGRQRPERKGLLHVGENRQGEVRFITPAQSFDIIITAEDDPTPEAPSNTLLVRGAVARAR